MRKLQVINPFSNVGEHQINTQKPVDFLCTNDRHTKKKIKETIPFIIASKKLVINITKISLGK